MFDFFGTFFLILFFAVGIVIGATVFPLKWLKANGRLQTAGISLTLFSMGASMGGSPTFLNDLQAAGLEALLYAVTTIAGSVLFVWFLSRVSMKKGGGGK